ncbi:hypothetical protein OV208_08145 [Corallococcus sp. bb12-1]|uniref:hypothetical protein n=1 Tax=Corallococcus sp. bb12-1 TaxID=2996784 RepID=UPI00226F51DB|nr:hypothetical protein [Corallococcus sp. bb12-1]MCY1041286.1 hypothetical protein [Corallococcus sp. bb12-1]
MKPGTSLLRAVALVCTSLALTACGGAMTPEEAAAEEALALATSEAELGSCGTWSGWTNTGASSCGATTSCGFYWVCEPFAKEGDPESLVGGGGIEGAAPSCPIGETARRYNYLGRFNQQSSYRVCFNEAGTYTHTEYQYQNIFNTCSC